MAPSEAAAEGGDGGDGAGSGGVSERRGWEAGFEVKAVVTEKSMDQSTLYC